MDHCQNGCPCDDFDCDLALNVTDPVYGLESIGIMETVGKFHSRYNFSDWYNIISGPIFNGECVDTSNDFHRDGTIYAHRSDYQYYNSTHIQDCSDYCLRHNPRKIANDHKTKNEGSQTNSTVEETTG